MFLQKIYTCCYLTVGKHGLRGSVKILLLTVLALCMFIFTLRLTETKPSFENLGPAFDIIQGNGQVHIDDITGFEQASDDEKIHLMNKIRNSIHNLMDNCTVKEQERCDIEKTEEKVLTLFTTWVYDKAKFPINSRTLHNWKILPNVNLVVFMSSEDTEVEKFSKMAGWDVLPITEEAAGAPILPTMFLDVMKKYKSKFYGYANGDILFTSSLIDTLKQILCQIRNNKINTSKGVLVVGRRVNIPAEKVTDKSAVSWPQLEQFSYQYGKLFQSDAEDYFITDSTYPWKQFLPVAVGRRGIDNWIVAFSRFSNITVIDTSESVLCIHQTLSTRGNFEGLEKGNYNMDLIRKLNMPFGLSWGRTYCTRWKSWYDLCGRLIIAERKSLDAECTTYRWTYRVASLFGFS